MSDSFALDLQPDAITPNDDQAEALVAIEKWAQEPGAELSLSGFAGTGKTTCVRWAKAFLGDTMWTAMTGKAATRLRDLAGVAATTLHSALYDPPSSGRLCASCQEKAANGDLSFCRSCLKTQNDLHFETVKDPSSLILVIDESSMVSPQIYADIQVWRAQGVRVLYVGDGFQLPPVLSKEEEKQFGKNDYSVLGKVPGSVLRQVMRNGDDILDVATLLRSEFRLSTESRGSYEFKRIPNVEREAIAVYLEDPDDHLLITWTNKTRMSVNLAIRRHYGFTGIRPEPGEPIIVRKNNLSSGVLNGEVYTISTIDEGPQLGLVPTVRIVTECGKSIFAHALTWDGQMPYLQNYDDWKSYKAACRRLGQDAYGRERGPAIEPIPVTYGHVYTAHLCQGSEARRVTVFMPQRDTAVSHWRSATALPHGGTAVFGARFLYTSITRAKQRVSVLMGA